MGRKIILVRHGERTDFALGRTWLTNCFDPEGKYISGLTNMPLILLTREGMPHTFKHDCPLTQTGLDQGRLVGQQLMARQVLSGPLQVFVSPALRSIQTAAAILEGMRMAGFQLEVKLKVEPSLFEWAGFYQVNKALPGWTSRKELIEGGYQIDLEYEPLLNAEELSVKESIEHYYKRTHEFIRNVLSKSGDDLLIVGHSATPDAGSRQLCGGRPLRNFQDMVGELTGVPYAGYSILEEKMGDGKWTVNQRADA